MILIIGAMDIEFRPLLKKIHFILKAEHKKYWLIIATYKGRDICLLKSGVGIKNSTKALKWSFDYLETLGKSIVCAIGLGVAGAVSPDLKIGDMMVPGIFCLEEERASLAADKYLLNMCDSKFKATMLTVKKVFYKEDKQAIIDKTVLSIDMESYVWAKILITRKIPFVIIKAISDSLDFVFPKDLSLIKERYTFYDLYFVLKKCFPSDCATIWILLKFALNWKKAVSQNIKFVLKLVESL